MHMLKRATRPLRREGERGAALVEAALIMPLVLLLTFGLWTTARAWNVSNTMEHAAREAVRFGVTELPWDNGSSPSGVMTVVNAELAGSSIASGSVVPVCIEKDTAPCSFSATPQGYEQVAVELQWPNYELNFLLFQMTIDLGVEAVGRYEG